MQLYKDNFYHIYNRSINHERLFYFDHHYDYFIVKIYRLRKYVRLIGYCLMPTHFHLVVQITSLTQDPLRRRIGDLLSGYTKAINRQYGRTGSLFQQHTKAKLISNEKYLLTILHYIHQNPVMSGLVDKIEEWKYSSYREYLGLRCNLVVEKEEILSKFETLDDFIKASNLKIDIMTM